MYDKLIDPIARMWASHPDAASFSLHWATIEQQLEADGNQDALDFARTIRSRAAEDMKAASRSRGSAPAASEEVRPH